MKSSQPEVENGIQKMKVIKKNWYWSLSPMIGHFVNHVFVLDTTGSLASAISDNGAPFAPVINLKAEYLDKLQGNGTIDNPYHL